MINLFKKSSNPPPNPASIPGPSKSNQQDDIDTFFNTGDPAAPRERVLDQLMPTQLHAEMRLLPERMRPTYRLFFSQDEKERSKELPNDMMLKLIEKDRQHLLEILRYHNSGNHAAAEETLNKVSANQTISALKKVLVKDLRVADFVRNYAEVNENENELSKSSPYSPYLQELMKKNAEQMKTGGVRSLRRKSKSFRRRKSRKLKTRRK
jgi:hypothetical protein